MPTFDVEDRFWSDYAGLTLEQKRQVALMRKAFVAILKAYEAQGCQGIPRFPKSLGVKHMVGNVGILELAWSADGRCTWQYGTPQKPGMYHVVWRRVGSHSIYADP